MKFISRTEAYSYTLMLLNNLRENCAHDALQLVDHCISEVKLLIESQPISAQAIEKVIAKLKLYIETESGTGFTLFTKPSIKIARSTLELAKVQSPKTLLLRHIDMNRASIPSKDLGCFDEVCKIIKRDNDNQTNSLKLNA